MNAMTRKWLVPAAILTFLSAVSAFAGAGDPPITLQKIDEVWNAKYEYLCYRSKALIPIIEQVGRYVASTTNESAVVMQESVLTKVFSMRVGTLEDREVPRREFPCELPSVREYLVTLSRWPSMRTDRNLILRVADNLARYKPLPDLNQTDAMRMAVRIDDYLKYGTNKPPFKAGWGTLWTGPVSEYVYKTAYFRELYNTLVKDMKELVFRVYRDVALETGFRDMRKEDRLQLWKEFLQRAGEPVVLE